MAELIVSYGSEDIRIPLGTGVAHTAKKTFPNTSRNIANTQSASVLNNLLSIGRGSLIKDLPCWFAVHSQRPWLAPDPFEGERTERLARAGRPAVVAQRFGVRSRLAGPLLWLEVTRAAAGSRLPAKEGGSKLPHSKARLLDGGGRRVATTFLSVASVFSGYNLGRRAQPNSRIGR